MDLSNRNILVVVGGSIAAYKSLELIRLLRSEGANVRVMPSKSALQFVGELSFEVLSGQKCLHESLHIEDGQISHIEEAYKADVMIFAPATANTIAKMSIGMADALALQTMLSFRGPCIIAPAMESHMWSHPATMENVTKLKARGCIFVGPEAGLLASGRVGLGRMAELGQIVEAVKSALTPQDFAGQRVLVTAGPSVEDIDPVRFIANRSSGKMGIALARALAQRGAEVCVVHGPILVPLQKHARIKTVAVRSAAQMLEQVNAHVDDCDIAILCAAVADSRPVHMNASKIKKKGDGLKEISLVPTVDILASLGQRSQKPFLVGFAAETENVAEEALRKCMEKNADLICGNDATLAMDADVNELLIVDKSGSTVHVPRTTKEKAAHAILDVVKSSAALAQASGKRGPA